MDPFGEFVKLFHLKYNGRCSPLSQAFLNLMTITIKLAGDYNRQKIANENSYYSQKFRPRYESEDKETMIIYIKTLFDELQLNKYKREERAMVFFQKVLSSMRADLVRSAQAETEEIFSDLDKATSMFFKLSYLKK